MKYAYSLIAALLISVLTLPLVSAATIDVNIQAEINLEYRDCQSNAEADYYDAYISAYQEYNQQFEQDLIDQRERVSAAWDIEADGDRNVAIRESDRAYAQASRDSKSELNVKLREARSNRSSARNTCRRAKSDAEREARNSGSFSSRSSSSRSSRSSFGFSSQSSSRYLGRCISSNECSNGRVCSVIYGDCLSACSPQAQTCTQVCAGTCVQMRTDNNQCTPYFCNDGTQQPSCTAQGNPIYYFVNPCNSHGGEMTTRIY